MPLHASPMTCRCGGRVGREKRASLSTSPWRGVPCPLRASTTVFRSCVWGGGAARRWGLVWQQAPIRQREVPVLAWPSVPVRLAPIRLLLTTEGPAVVCSERAQSLARRAGRVPSCLCLFPSCFLIPISFAAPAPWTSCQVHEKFAVQPPSAVVLWSGVGGKERWMCAVFPLHCLSVCLTGDLCPLPQWLL